MTGYQSARNHGVGEPLTVIYRLCDIEAYENECLVSSTAEFRKNTKLSAV